MAGESGTGASSYVMFAEETVPGTPNTTFTDPGGNTLYVETNSGSSDPKVISKSFMAGNRFAEIGVRIGKFTSNAQLTYPMFPYMGHKFLKHAVGKYTNVAAVASSNTTSISTTGNQTTLTFTTAPTVQLGQWIQIDTGSAMEMRQVLATTATTIVVSILDLVHAAVTAVQGPAQHKFSPLVQGDTGFSTLPTSTVAFVRSGNWAWYRAGTYVSGMKFAGGAEDLAVTLGLAPTVMPTRPTNPPTLAPQANEAADADTYYTINDGFIVVPNDQGATGTSTLQILKEVTSWSVDIQNSMVQLDGWNGNKHSFGYPGTGKVLIDYQYANFAKRNAPWEDYVASNAIADVPFFASCSINRGTPGSPVMNCLGFYVPHAVQTKAADTDVINQMESIQVTAQASRPTGGDAIQIFSINALTPAANAY